MKTVQKTMFLLFSIITLNISAQSFNNSNSLADGFRLGIEDKKGHPFLINDWHSGNLVKNDGSATEKMLLNYHVVDNVLVSMKMVNGEKTFFKLNTNDYTGFVIKDDKNRVHLYTKVEGSQFSKKKKETKFYLIVSVPNKNVLLETTKSFKDPNANGWSASTNTTKRGSFKTRTQAYVLTKSGKYAKVKLSNSGIQKVFKDKKKELKSYMNKNNIRVEEAKDLVKVVEYYHSL